MRGEPAGVAGRAAGLARRRLRRPARGGLAGRAPRQRLVGARGAGRAGGCPRGCPRGREPAHPAAGRPLGRWHPRRRQIDRRGTRRRMTLVPAWNWPAGQQMHAHSSCPAGYFTSSCCLNSCLASRGGTSRSAASRAAPRTLGRPASTLGQYSAAGALGARTARSGDSRRATHPLPAPVHAARSPAAHDFLRNSCSTACPAGQYQGSAGQTSCASCPSGQFTASAGNGARARR